jgi:molybdenum cofactor biosynthesis enzyme MoaA
MHIFNIRKGFATNSSSSHSILLLPNVEKKISTDEYTDFGWQFFTLADQTSKENYFATALKYNLEQCKVAPKEINKYLTELFGSDIVGRVEHTNIDHQSVLTFPRTWDNKGINKEFISEMAEYIKRPDVVVAGGNDNDSKEHELTKVGIKSPLDTLPKESSGDHFIARKEDDYWTIFSRSDGSKMRFSFTSEVAPEKALAPELADIKITDFCPYACEFCYQDSTLEGKHSSLENMRKIADAMEKAQVFEVALGGGETTLHPNFVEILKMFKEKNIVPNFTTKNLNLLRQSNALDILEHCGAMAFSVQSVEDIHKVQSALMDFEKRSRIETASSYYMDEDQKTSVWNPKINFQIVMGSMPMKEFKEMLQAAQISGKRVTLLGYKENGRGSSFAPHDYSDWLNVVEKMQKTSFLQVSIDTALASEFEKELLNKKVDPSTFHTTEGTFSAYVDATKMALAPSSYVGLEQSQPFDEKWLEKYKTMRAKPEYKKTIKINN